MTLFRSILAKLEATVQKQNETPNTVAEIVSKILGVPVSIEQISIRDGVLKLQLPATLKFALKMKQEIILQELISFKITKVL